MAQTIMLRRLARSLLSDDFFAQDVVQDAWLVAARHKKADIRNPQGWLVGVLKNLVRKRHLLDRHRTEREYRVAETADHGSPPADDVVDRLEALRLLATFVSALNEPYRTTVVSCYLDGRRPSELATEQGIPAATVRWRLKYGLDRLRKAFDQHYLGDRKAWRALLLPVAYPRGSQTDAYPTKSSVSETSAVTNSFGGSLSVGVMLTILTGGTLFLIHGPASQSNVPTPVEAPAAPGWHPTWAALSIGANPFAPETEDAKTQDEGLVARGTRPAVTTVMSFDFEDGLLPSVFSEGHVVLCPWRLGNRYCLIGTVDTGYALSGVISMGSPQLDTPIFNYSRRKTISFDYWVGKTEPEDCMLTVSVHVPEKRCSFKARLKALEQAAWTHVEVPLASLGPASSCASTASLEDGDGIGGLSIFGSRNGAMYSYVDNIRIAEESPAP